jgi:hypothetical protein
LRERLGNKTAEVEAVRQQLHRGARPGGAAGRPRRRSSSVSFSRRPRRRTHWGAASRSSAHKLEEQARFLTDYENAADRLRNEAMSARESESALRAELDRNGRSLSRCDRYRDHREVVDRKRAQEVPGRSAPSCSATSRR